VPVDLPEILRALQLLGAVVQAGGRIREKHRQELVRLLGCVPDQQQAAHWKKSLKEIRREVAEEEAEEAREEADG
jgi:single-stranded DNA-specific DHH superfamily exonuclease